MKIILKKPSLWRKICNRDIHFAGNANDFNCVIIMLNKVYMYLYVKQWKEWKNLSTFDNKDK